MAFLVAFKLGAGDHFVRHFAINSLKVCLARRLQDNAAQTFERDNCLAVGK